MDVVASISDRVGDVGEYLREQRESARLSVRQLATLAGVSNPYLSQVERGLRKPSAEVLQQIAKGLRISAEALYIRAGILDNEGRPDVEAAVYADPYLNDRQRRVLLDIYASFRAENAHADEAEVQAADVDTLLVPQEPPAPVRVPRKRTAVNRTATKRTTGKRAVKRAAAATEATTEAITESVAELVVEPDVEPVTEPTTSTGGSTAEPAAKPAKKAAVRRRTRSS